MTYHEILMEDEQASPTGKKMARRKAKKLQRITKEDTNRLEYVISSMISSFT
jgi:hypothetical protein